MSDEDDEAGAYWRRFVWNRYALALCVVLTAIGLVVAARQVRLADNVSKLNEFYKQADADAP